MSILTALKGRRSYYALGKDLPVSESEIIDIVNQATELVPDAFNMKSSRVVVVLGDAQEKLWDTVYDAFGGQVAKERLQGFRAGAGTVLFFYDEEVTDAMATQFAPYASNFPIWANQASAMLQLAIWTALKDAGIGANVQHYNPVIDDSVKSLFDLPKSYKLVAQMPFGNILVQPDAKEKEDITNRVFIRK